MIGLNLFGAVVNLSAMAIVGDQLARGRAMAARESLLLSRTFSMAVFYSPFIGGMALALHHAPGARFATFAPYGIALVVCGMIYVYRSALASGTQGLADFEGYPMHLERLWLPLALALGVLSLHALAPQHSVLALIAFIAPTLSLLVVLGRDGVVRTKAALGAHLRTGLPAMGGELALFLSAGVLAVGLAALLATFEGATPFERLDALTATLSVAVAVALAFVGIHPVVPATSLATALAPYGPDPDLLVLTFVLAWGIGCAVSPFSSINLTMQGRYGVRAWQFPRRNLGFAAYMLVCVAVLMHAYEWVRSP